MDFFNYRNGELYCEDVPAERIAREVGTPAYVYSKATLLHHYRQIAEAFAPLKPTVCYSVKSLGNVHVCKVLADAGCGFDVTSGGVHIHIGSPVYTVEPYVDAVKKVTALIDRLTERGHRIEWFDVGGGFGVNYERPDQALPVTEHAKALVPLLKDKPYRIAFEPGRYIAGNAGILLTKVLYRKQGGEKKFVIVDAGMNDLIRPTLYESYHHIWPAKPQAANVNADRRRDFVVQGGDT